MNSIFSDHLPLRDKLLANGRKQQEALQTGEEIDFVPVVRLMDRDTGCCWLLTELDPENPEIAYALSDYQNGNAELEELSLTELQAACRGTAFGIEIDTEWTPAGTLSAYVAAAKVTGYIEELDEL